MQASETREHEGLWAWTPLKRINRNFWPPHLRPAAQKHLVTQNVDQCEGQKVLEGVYGWRGGQQRRLWPEWDDGCWANHRREVRTKLRARVPPSCLPPRKGRPLLAILRIISAARVAAASSSIDGSRSHPRLCHDRAKIFGEERIRAMRGPTICTCAISVANGSGKTQILVSALPPS